MRLVVTILSSISVHFLTLFQNKSNGVIKNRRLLGQAVWTWVPILSLASNTTLTSHTQPLCLNCFLGCRVTTTHLTELLWEITKLLFTWVLSQSKHWGNISSHYYCHFEDHYRQTLSLQANPLPIPSEDKNHAFLFFPSACTLFRYPKRNSISIDCMQCTSSRVKIPLKWTRNDKSISLFIICERIKL